MNLRKIVTSKIRGKPFSDGIRWEPQYNTRFHVVDKHTGQVGYFKCIVKVIGNKGKFSFG